MQLQFLIIIIIIIIIITLYNRWRDNSALGSGRLIPGGGKFPIMTEYETGWVRITSLVALYGEICLFLWGFKPLFLRHQARSLLTVLTTTVLVHLIGNLNLNKLKLISTFAPYILVLSKFYLFTN